jgi:hypothetical protein
MSRSLDVALHMGEEAIELPDRPPPAAGYVLAAGNTPAAGNPVTIVWQPSGGAGGLPTANKEGDLLVSKRVQTAYGPQLDWLPDDFDGGRY